VAWISGTGPEDLNAEEGTHFHWHLQARGRNDLRVTFCGNDGRPVNVPNLTNSSDSPAYRIWGGRVCPPCASGFQEKAHLVVRYWAGQKAQVCSVGG
jgi:hypothetical protein